MQLGDARLMRRASLVVTQFAKQPSASIPQACEHWSDIKAAYRFLSNEKIEPQQLLAPHAQATVRRMQAHPTVLAIQDTTQLNYSSHRGTKGLGPIGNNPDKTLGFFLHATLMVTTSGCPLGIVHATTYRREARAFGSSRDAQVRNRKSMQEKESLRWLDSLRVCQGLAPACPQTMIVNIADREGDIYELFAQALSPESQPYVHLLVRMQHNRNVQGGTDRLFHHLRAQPVEGRLQVKVPRNGTQPERTAIVSLRYCPVRIDAPLLKEGLPSLKLWAIEAEEEHPPKGVLAISWRLLTTLPVANVAEATQRIGWYAQRWQIEVMHKVLKSGCRIQERQLETVDRLKRALMVDLVVAWRVMYLHKVLRDQPDQPADQHLSEAEWKVLLWKFSGEPSMRPPSIRQAVRWIGQLGGFIGRKSDGEPGPMVLWRGLQRLEDLIEAWSIAQSCG
jgi:hypothetical protein